MSKMDQKLLKMVKNCQKYTTQVIKKWIKKVKMHRIAQKMTKNGKIVNFTRSNLGQKLCKNSQKNPKIVSKWFMNIPKSKIDFFCSQVCVVVQTQNGTSLY